MKRGIAAIAATSWVCATSVSHSGSSLVAKSWKLASPSTTPVVMRASVSIAPASHSVRSARVTMPAWMRRRRCALSAAASASGTEPIPNWSVSPSRTSAATWLPMRVSMSPTAGSVKSSSGASASTLASSSETWMRKLPRVCCMRGFRCATRWRARDQTSGMKSLARPGLHQPSASGGVSCAIATSTGAASRSWRTIAGQSRLSSSARPVAMPTRTDGDMK